MPARSALLFVVVLDLTTHSLQGTGQPLITDIGFIVEVDALVDIFLGRPGGICAAVGRAQGIGGIGSCICQIVSLIMPIRDRPGEPISDTNCPIVDLCCPLRDVLFVLKDTIKFAIHGLATLWQSWNPANNDRCEPGMLQPGQSCASLGSQPYAFLDYTFCNELTPEEISMLPLSPNQLLEQQKCGKFLPIIDAFTVILSSCPCQFLSLADAWLATYFHGFDCFCGPVNGLMVNLGGVVNAVLKSVVTLIRRIKDVSYWQPYGAPSLSNQANQYDQTHTWTFGFFGPIIDALCNVFASVSCFLVKTAMKQFFICLDLTHSFVRVCAGHFAALLQGTAAAHRQVHCALGPRGHSQDWCPH